MKMEITKAEKGRRTTLSRKSVEDLVNIIIRKDATERKLNAKINEYKGQFNSMQSHINSALTTLRQCKEQVVSLNNDYKRVNEELDTAMFIIKNKTKELRSKNKVIILLSIVLIIDVILILLF